MRRLSIVWFLILLWSLSAFAQQQPPTGYRFPTGSDIIYDWKEWKAPIHVKADFNGDGVQDHAWILLKEKGSGWGLFVFLGRKNEKPQIIKLEENKGESSAQRFGISLAPPSKAKWKTACGKGYFECKRGEPEEIQITLPSIEFCLIESSCYLFMWDNKSGAFRKVQLSD
jgi:hypothetical protein